MVFSDTTGGLGIVEQVRNMMRVDSNQWSTAKIANSCNNYLDTIAGYLIATDKRFQWDDTNHSKLPIGTTNLVASQSDYSFLTDEQNNPIITITRIEIKDSAGNWREVGLIDQSEVTGALVNYSPTTPKYDKIADNIIRLYPTPTASITSGLKFYFQRTPSYFVATDTTKNPGVSPLLHRGFVIAAAYDGAITLGLQNLQPLSVEMQREEEKMIRHYSASRNRDLKSGMSANVENNK